MQRSKFLTANTFMPAWVVTILVGLISAGPGSLGAHENATAGKPARHPVSITQADVFVNRSRLTIRVKAFADDLEFIQGVEAYEETGRYDAQELREATKDHGEFLIERIEIFDSGGKRLKGRITETVDLGIPDAGVPSGGLMEYELQYTFEYDYETPPEYLTFQHEIIDDNFLFPSEVKLLVKQAGSDAPYLANLKRKTPETIRFDWDKPLSRTASGDELRDWFDEQREKTLGITSYGSVYSFIYITPTEVRQEVLVPLANLAAMLDFRQADESYLQIPEQDDAKVLIQELFSTGNPVTIDGKIVPPRFDRFDFYGLNIRDFAVQAQRRRISLANGRVGIIMSYPSNGTPQEVQVTWDKFSKTLKDVEVVVFALDKTDRTQFSRFLTDNTYEWSNPGIEPLPQAVPVQVDSSVFRLKYRFSWFWTLLPFAIGGLVCWLVPSARKLVAVLVLVAAGILTYAATFSNILTVCEPMPEADAKAVFESLHDNLFRAFEYYREDDVYDALAASTSGPLLKEIYLKMRKSLEVKEQGGAVANIQNVEIMIGKMSPTPALGTILDTPDFAYRCRWNIVGTIEHWGHIHQRTNTYDAVFNVEQIDNQWKFTKYEPLDEQQGVVKTRVRKF